MTRRILCAVVFLTLTVAFCPEARAQSFGQPSPFGGTGFSGRRGPALSPFLNLRRGGSPAANYFLGVLPEQDRRTNKAEVNAALNDLERRGEAPGSTDDLLGTSRNLSLPPTGHATYFGNYGGFYSIPVATPLTPARTRGR